MQNEAMCEKSAQKLVVGFDQQNCKILHTNCYTKNYRVILCIER